MASIKKEIDKAWKMYNRWRNQKIVSPALKKQVMFTRQGWEHITGRDDKKRTLADIYRRLKLLPHAKTIISKMPLVQNKRKRGEKWTRNKKSRLSHPLGLWPLGLSTVKTILTYHLYSSRICQYP